METVEVVIRLSKFIYNNVVNYTLCGNLASAVREGTVLPKGHGRLIDVDAVNVNETIGGKNEFADCIREAIQTTLNNAPTIIGSRNDDNG